MSGTTTTMTEVWALCARGATRFELARDETLALPRGIAWAVRVERGTVLVTQAGDPDDHVLEGGDELVTDDDGLAVAWALTDARLSLRAAERRLAA